MGLALTSAARAEAAGARAATGAASDAASAAAGAVALTPFDAARRVDPTAVATAEEAVLCAVEALVTLHAQSGRDVRGAAEGHASPEAMPSPSPVAPPLTGGASGGGSTGGGGSAGGGSGGDWAFVHEVRTRPPVTSRDLP